MPRILTPNVNFSPASRKDVLLSKTQSAIRFDADQLRRTAEICGYGGIELHALRSPHLVQLQQRTEAARRLAACTFAIHEGWRGVGEPIPQDPDRAVRPLIETKDSLLQALAIRALFPRGRETLPRLQKYLTELGRHASDLVQVVYPDTNGSAEADKATKKQFPNAAAQLTPDILASWGVDSPDGLVNALGEHDLQVVYDNFHFTRQGKVVEGVLDQEAYLPALLKNNLVSAVHVGLFRGDFSKVDPYRTALSMEEGRAFASGNTLPSGTGNEALVNTFAILQDHSWNGNVTIEAPLGHMANALGYRNWMSNAAMINHHQELVTGVQDSMPWIPQETWLPIPYASQAA